MESPFEKVWEPLV